MTSAPETLKACCASAYASAGARWLLGPSFHPGGTALTSELVRALRVGPGETVADVASGPGTSALQLARETGCYVIGIDLSEESVAAAAKAAEAAGLGDQVRFVHGDAEELPLATATLDGALSECSLCLFPDKEAAAAELARVLRPGARLALSDVVADGESLPAELRTASAWAACLADARPPEEIAGLLESAGLRVEASERRDGALAELLDRVEGRLAVARLVGDRLPDGLGSGVGRWIDLAAKARQALDEGILGYVVVVARRP